MWFVCMRRSVLPREQWTVGVDEHLAWMRQQHEAGVILMSGPGTYKGEQYSIYLIHAPSKTEAEEIAAGDPFTVAGHSAFELIEWDVHQILGAGPFQLAAFNR